MWHQMVGAFRNAIDGTASAPSFTGPGDVVGSAIGWWGLRGYSAAYAAPGNNPAIDVVDTATGLIQTTINILSNGNLDDATILGLGYAVSVKKIYDQTGNGNHLTQNTLSAMPALTQNVVGSLPGMTFTFAASSFLETVSFTGSGNALPITFSWVGKRIGSFTTDTVVIRVGNIITGFSSFRNTADTVSIEANDDGFTLAATDNVFHAVQALDNNGSSTLYSDGTSTSPATAIGSNLPTAHIAFGGFGTGMDVILCEGGLWGAGFTSPQMSSMNSNQHSYWGF